MADTKYLRMHCGQWQVQLDVPIEVRPKLGRRLRRYLQTTSLPEANRKKLAVIVEFKQQIEDARKGVLNPKLAIIREAESVVRRMKELKDFDEKHPSGHVVNWRSEEFSDATERAQEIEDTLGPELGSLFMETIKAKGTIIADKLDRHVDEMESTNQTKVLTRSAINRFLGWAGEFTSFEAIDRKKAREYITDHLMKDPDLSKRSVERHRSHLSGLWKWADASGLVEPEVNPWIGHNLGGAKKRKRGQQERQPLKNEQVLKLLNGVYHTTRYKQIVSDLLRIGLVTGMRLDEICALRREDVTKREDGWWFTITDGKTDAAVRELPVHNFIASIIERRLADNDEFLFKDLTVGGPDEKRSWYVGRAYKRYRKSVGVEGKGEVFHTLRHTYTDMMEGEDVPESTVKLLVGHKRESMTFGRYSKGQRLKLREIINRLSYSPEIHEAIKRNPASSIDRTD